MVYFLSNFELTRVKIGKSHQLPQRMRALQNGSAEPLLLVADLDGYTSVEAWLHQKFARNRMHGEWFSVDQELAITIARIQTLGTGAWRELCPDAHAEDTRPPALRNYNGLTVDIVNEARGRYEHGEPITSVLYRFPKIQPADLTRAILGITWREVAFSVRKPPAKIKRLLTRKSWRNHAC